MDSTNDLRRPVGKDGTNRYLHLAMVITILLSPPILFSWADQPPEVTTTAKPESSTANTARNLEEKSRARAVTAADVIGTVRVQRPGYTIESPMAVNTPIQEGFRIATAADSSTGIQFEHDSTAIVGAQSRVFFEQLELDANGNRLTGMTLEHGLVTVHFLPQRHPNVGNDPRGDARLDATALLGTDVYEIKIAEAKATAAGKCRFRVDVQAGYVRLEVFKGEVNFAIPGTSVTLGPGKFLEHKLGSQETTFDIHRGIVRDPWDTWTLAEEQKILSEPKSASYQGRQSGEASAMMGQRHGNSSSPTATWVPPHAQRRY